MSNLSLKFSVCCLSPVICSGEDLQHWQVFPVKCTVGCKWAGRCFCISCAVSDAVEAVLGSALNDWWWQSAALVLVKMAGRGFLQSTCCSGPLICSALWVACHGSVTNVVLKWLRHVLRHSFQQWTIMLNLKRRHVIQYIDTNQDWFSIND